MTARVVLFIQGSGGGTHDEWDRRLVDSLQDALGEGWEIRYPRMPDEGHPEYEPWRVAIDEALDRLGDGAVVVGHSVGGTVLAAALAQRTPAPRLAAIVLVSAPFTGPGGWEGVDPALPPDLADRLGAGVPVHVFHGLDDDVVPSSHAVSYGRVLPEAVVHLLPGRDHQLDEDLAPVAAILRAVRAETGGLNFDARWEY